jgi:short subunit dehydrogenase-like uncharacterized protein
MSERSYDVVLYGATGFVGKQTVQYFARHAAAEPVRWAIAGRNHQKLAAVRDEISAAVDVLVSDNQDQQAIDAIVSQTRVLLTTAGPFARYGNALVDACVRFQTIRALSAAVLRCTRSGMNHMVPTSPIRSISSWMSRWHG